MSRPGRPTKPPEEKMRSNSIRVYFPDDLMLSLHVLARKRGGASLSGLVREIVALELRRENTPTP